MHTTTVPTHLPTAAADPHPDGPPTPDRSMARIGAWGAAVSALTYVIGFGLLGAYLAPRGFLDGEDDPATALEFLLDHQAVLYAWHAVLYLLGAASLALLVISLRTRLRPVEPVAASLSGALGTIWSGLLFAAGMVALVGQQAVVHLHGIDPDQATSAWTTVGIVQDSLGGGIELVGGLWILAVAWAGLRSGRLARGACRLGLVVGVAGVATVIPAFAPAAAVFGLGTIAWFVWSALELRRP